MLSVLILILLFDCLFASNADSSHVDGGYNSLKEFADDWSPPLSKEEVALFEPESEKNITRFMFKKDATIRGIFCAENIIVATNKMNPNIEFLSPAFHPPPRCKYNKFNFAGKAVFRKKPFSPISVHFDLMNNSPGARNELDGFKFGQMSIYFEPEKMIRKKLDKTVFSDKKFYVISGDTDKTAPANIMLAETVVLNGASLPAGAKIFFEEVEIDGKPTQSIDFIELWEGYEVVYQGIHCRDKISLAQSDLIKCTLAKPLTVNSVEIPMRSLVRFDPALKKNGIAAPAIVIWPHSTKEDTQIYGKRKPIQIIGDRITEDGVQARSMKIDDLQSFGGKRD